MESTKPRMFENSTVQKKRGKLLSFLIIVQGLLYLLGLPYFLNIEVLGEVYRFNVVWVAIWQVATYVFGIAALIGIFFWKRWAVYIFFIVGTIGLILNEILWNASLVQTVTGLLVLFLWFTAIKRKWSLFQ